MITDGILTVVGFIITFIGSLLPSTALTGLPTAITGFGAAMGEKAGPINQFFPVEEMCTALLITFVYWLPAVLLYQFIFWIYAHLPVIGKG